MLYSQNYDEYEVEVESKTTSHLATTDGTGEPQGKILFIVWAKKFSLTLSIMLVLVSTLLHITNHAADVDTGQPALRLRTTTRNLLLATDKVVVNNTTPITPISIGIVSFVKDDADILPYWLEYHSSIFGVKQLAIIDHDSQNNETRRILNEWKYQKGLRIIHSNVSYLMKGEVTYRALKFVFPHADLYMPLDIDEFVVYNTPHNLTTTTKSQTSSITIPTFNKTLILDAFQQIWNDNNNLNATDNKNPKQKKKCWGTLHGYNSHPMTVNDTLQSITYVSPFSRKPANTKKIVLNIPEFMNLDHGNHCPVVKGISCLYNCKMSDRLGLLHYHFRNPIETVKRAIVDLSGLCRDSGMNSNATIDNIHTYRKVIKHIVDQKLNGLHKAREVLNYLNEGLPGVMKSMYEVFPKQGELIEIGSIDSIIEQIKYS